MNAPETRLVEAQTSDALDAAICRYGPYLRRVARRLADGDAALARDMEQEALILLWELDPTRFDLAEPRDGDYLQLALTHRMRRIRRTELRRAHHLTDRRT
jgi:DNA-directed RNA polymerase specialized sigma24 family protein